MQNVIRFVACCGVSAVFAILVPLVATAHEHRDLVGGQYEVTIGFITEPAFVAEMGRYQLGSGA
jgi:hypothetical protein